VFSDPATDTRNDLSSRGSRGSSSSSSGGGGGGGSSGGGGGSSGGLSVRVFSGQVSGNWSSIGISSEAASAPLFRAWVVHPAANDDDLDDDAKAKPRTAARAAPASFAALVQPGVPLSAFAPADFLVLGAVDVVRNDPGVQAVLLEAQGVLGVALYPPVDDEDATATAAATATQKSGGTFGGVSLRGRQHAAPWNFDVYADVPCALLVQLEPASRGGGRAGVGDADKSATAAPPPPFVVWVSVSDPAQVSAAVTVTFEGLCLESAGGDMGGGEDAGGCGICVPGGNRTVMRVDFPQQSFAGSSVTARCAVVAISEPE
jgi:hypothetical protein